MKTTEEEEEHVLNLIYQAVEDGSLGIIDVQDVEGCKQRALVFVDREKQCLCPFAILKFGPPDGWMDANSKIPRRVRGLFDPEECDGDGT